MKHLLLLLLVVSLFFCLVENSVAASKPPAKLCIDMTPGLDSYLVIVTKSVASVTMADGSTAFYSLNGAVFATPNVTQWNVTLTGTGHMYKDVDADWFHFSATGFSHTPFGWDPIDIEVYWNVVTKTGTLNYYLPRTGWSKSIVPVEIDCKKIELPLMP
jgi:hypothetical protein